MNTIDNIDTILEAINLAGFEHNSTDSLTVTLSDLQLLRTEVLELRKHAKSQTKAFAMEKSKLLLEVIQKPTALSIYA